MGSGEQVLSDAIAFLQSAFASVNGVKGLLIAVLGAYYLTEWRRVFAVALGAMAEGTKERSDSHEATKQRREA